VSTVKYSSIDQAADEIIRRLNGKIILGIPLGLGKPNQLVNALYQKIKSNPQHTLTIYTALSLTKPVAKGDLEKRFLQPFVDRLFGVAGNGGYVELDYLQARRTGTLPPNINVYEFFEQPGAELNNHYTQQHYMSSNYTHAARDINNHGINILAQLIAEEKGQYSLSCNPEVTLDILPLMHARKQKGETIIVVGQIHHHLPFMGNSAVVSDDMLDMVIDDSSCQTTLMNTPDMPVSMAEHFIGLQTSALIRDGGTVQIGIGALGDAVTGAILLRQQDNGQYQKLLRDVGMTNQYEKLINQIGGVQIFQQGLYGCSEMLTYGMFRLFQEKIICRSVKDTRHEGVSGASTDICLHGGFFLGPTAFYEGLKNLSAEDRSKIDMTNISFVNHLYGDEELKREHRQQARFINTAFTVTLMGAVVSDQLEDGRVLSGVGGQYNFVAQSHELEGARLIILVRAVRDTAEGVSSNIFWNYGHTTIPRHLRDIIVTEYGIADLRGKCDSEVIAAMLSVCDSRFQEALIVQAKSHGKIAADYVIPEVFRENTPERLQKIYDKYYAQVLFPDFPLGCDFTETEQQLLKALTWLKEQTRTTSGLLKALCRGALHAPGLVQHAPAVHACLDRMNLAQPKTLKEKVYQMLLMVGLEETKSH
jgi:acyl-CoA hydrolase